jgi:hypothetical protein
MTSASTFANVAEIKESTRLKYPWLANAPAARSNSETGIGMKPLMKIAPARRAYL